MSYFIYLVECIDKTIYCGYTNNLEKRVKAHNSSKNGAKYTKARRPVKLIYTECFPTKSEAMKREYEIKQLTRNQKLELTKPKIH